ncbi:unnamed protein product, partial [Coregonus sp. 'balchen']
MRDQFTKLEGEVVLLRESVSKQQPDIHTLEELLTKVRTEQDSSLATQLKEVQQQRDGLKRELADLTKEAYPALPVKCLPPSPQSSLPLTAAPAHTSHTPGPTPTSPHSTPSSPEETLAEIVLLMDSNGKFVQENKLFPRHKTRKDVALNRSPTSPPRNSGAISTPQKDHRDNTPDQHPGPPSHGHSTTNLNAHHSQRSIDHPSPASDLPRRGLPPPSTPPQTHTWRSHSPAGRAMHKL